MLDEFDQSEVSVGITEAAFRIFRLKNVKRKPHRKPLSISESQYWSEKLFFSQKSFIPSVCLCQDVAFLFLPHRNSKNILSYSFYIQTGSNL